MSTLGKILNNPLNIRYNSVNKWKGQKEPKKGFCSFSKPVYGIRAGLVLLRKYRYQYGLESTYDIVLRWAPPSDGNDTISYSKFIVDELNKVLGFKGITIWSPLKFDFFDFTDKSCLYYFVKAMCKIESQYDLSLDEFQCALILLDPNIRPFSDVHYRRLLNML